VNANCSRTRATLAGLALAAFGISVQGIDFAPTPDGEHANDLPGLTPATGGVHVAAVD
jgi:hypothetical protein